MFDGDSRTDVGQRRNNCENPRQALLVIDQGTVLDSEFAGATSDDRCLQRNSARCLVGESDFRGLRRAGRFQRCRFVRFGTYRLDLCTTGQ